MENYNGVNKKTVIWLVVIIVLALAGSCGAMVWYMNNLVKNISPAAVSQKTNPIDNNPDKTEGLVCAQDAKQCPDGSYVSRTGPNCQFAPCPEASANQPIEQPANQIGSTAGTVYTSKEFGFQVTIPQGYGDYKAMVEKDPAGQGATYVHFIFKTKEPNATSENFVTHEKYPGYADIFALGVWNMANYNKIVADCKINPYPDCPYNIIGQNDKYVVDTTLGNGMPPKDLENLRNMLDKSKDIGKLLEFKFVN